MAHNTAAYVAAQSRAWKAYERATQAAMDTLTRAINAAPLGPAGAEAREKAKRRYLADTVVELRTYDEACAQAFMEFLG